MAISNLETEYKLRAPDEATLSAIAALPSIAGLRLVPAGRKELTDTYFDTPNFDLSRARLALRVRESSSGSVVALKEVGTIEAGLHVRGELEEAGSVGDRLSTLPPGQIRAHLTHILAPDARLRPLAVLHQIRDIFAVVAPVGDTIGELSLDRVGFATETPPSLHMVELEAKASGNESLLALVAHELSKRFGLVADSRTKLECALASGPHSALLGK